MKRIAAILLLGCAVAFGQAPPLPPDYVKPAHPVKIKPMKQTKPVSAMSNLELAKGILSGKVKTYANQQAAMERWARETVAETRVHVPKRAKAAPKDFRK